MTRAFTFILILGTIYGCAQTNRAPILASLQDQTISVGQTTVLSMTASDPDGDALEFRLDGQPMGSDWWLQGPQNAIFRWTPLLPDAYDHSPQAGRRYLLIFSVIDTHGAWDEQQITLIVNLPEMPPTFQIPAGQTLDVARQAAVEVIVDVKDDDSETITLWLEQGVEGAEWRIQGTHSALFRWQPSESQIADQTVYTVVFAADDGVCPPVFRSFSIVLFKSDLADERPIAMPSCAGTS